MIVKKIPEVVCSMVAPNVVWVKYDLTFIPYEAILPVAYKQSSPPAAIILLVIDVPGPVILMAM